MVDGATPSTLLGQLAPVGAKSSILNQYSLDRRPTPQP